MNVYVVINLVVFVGLIVFLARFGGSKTSLSRKILAGLGLGIAFGLALQFAYGGSSEAVQETLTWTNVIGRGYSNLLRMVILPLVVVMMIGAGIRMRGVAARGGFVPACRFRLTVGSLWDAPAWR